MRGAYTTAIFPTVAFLVGSHLPTCPADCDANGKLNVNDYVCLRSDATLGIGVNVSDFVCFRIRGGVPVS